MDKVPSHPEAFLPDTATQEFPQTYSMYRSRGTTHPPASQGYSRTGTQKQTPRGGVSGGNPGISAELPGPESTSSGSQIKNRGQALLVAFGHLTNIRSMLQVLLGAQRGYPLPMDVKGGWGQAEHVARGECPPTPSQQRCDRLRVSMELRLGQSA